jgi:hypothetical protein
MRFFNASQRAELFARKRIGALEKRGFKISPQAKNVLIELGVLRPDLARDVLKRLRSADCNAFGIEKIRFPKKMLDATLIPHLNDLKAHIYKCKSKNAMDVSLLEKFIPKKNKIIQEMPFDFRPGIKPAEMSDEEHSNLKLIRLLRKTHLRFLSLSDIRAKAKITGDQELLGSTELAIDDLLLPLTRARDEIGLSEEGYRKVSRRRIEDAIYFLRVRNTSAANSSIISAYNEIFKQADRLEGKRLKRNGKPKKIDVTTAFGKQMRSLTLSGYKIRISPDGTWRIPQGGFKAAGTEHFKETIPHKVSQDKVVRRNRHIIDSCASELSLNVHNIKLLIFARSILEKGREASQSEIVSVNDIIRNTAKSYDKVFVRKKEEVYDRLTESLFALERGIVKLSLSMVKISINLLNRRNEELSSMIENLTAKGALELSEIQSLLRRDQQIRTTVHNLLSAISHRSAFSSYQAVEGAAKRIEIFLKGYLTKTPLREYGIKRAIQRFEAAQSLLRRTAELVKEKANWEKYLELTRNENVLFLIPSTLPITIDLLSSRIASNLASAADILYTTNMDLEFKHREKVNEGEISERVRSENRVIREKIGSSLKDKKDSGNDQGQG